MNDVLDDEVYDRAWQRVAAEDSDPQAKARLAYRMQALRTIRARREAQEYWAQERAARARAELAARRLVPDGAADEDTAI